MSTYNGWANYETYATKLWLDNEEPTYREAIALARKAQRKSLEPWEFGRLLKDWLEDDMPDLGPSLWSDLLGSAFSDIEWTEIAQAYLEETYEEDAEDAEDEEDAEEHHNQEA